MIIKEVTEERCDVLSKYVLNKMEKMAEDPTIDGFEKFVLQEKLRNLSTTYSGTVLLLAQSFNPNTPVYISHTVGVFDEEGEKDGVYVYIGFDDIADKDLPPNKRYDNTYTLFASTDPDDLSIMIYYGDDAVCRVDMRDKIPEVSTPDNSHNEIADNVRRCVVSAISMMKAAITRAYLDGLNYGKNWRKNNDEKEHQ